MPAEVNKGELAAFGRDQEQVSFSYRRALVPFHITDRDDEPSVIGRPHRHRPPLPLAHEEGLGGAVEAAAALPGDMLADRAIAPVGDQHGIFECRPQHAVVIPALPYGDVELQIHNGQDIPALDVLSGSPPPHPAMPGLWRHITQAPWRMEAALLVVIVYEQVPVRVKGNTAGIAHPAGVNAEAVVF